MIRKVLFLFLFTIFLKPHTPCPASNLDESITTFENDSQKLEVLVSGYSFADLTCESQKVFPVKNGEIYPIVAYEKGWFKIYKRDKGFAHLPLFRIRVLSYPGELHPIGFTLQELEPLYSQFFPKISIKKFLKSFTPFIILRKDIKPWGIFLVVTLENGDDGFLHLHSRGSRNLLTGKPLNEGKKVDKRKAKLKWEMDQGGQLVPLIGKTQNPKLYDMEKWGLFLQKYEFYTLFPWMKVLQKKDIIEYLEKVVFNNLRLLHITDKMPRTELFKQIFYRALWNPLGDNNMSKTISPEKNFYLQALTDEFERRPTSSELYKTFHNLFFFREDGAYLKKN
ncbi:hypothetical protein ACFL35_05240 [Candidatus Riflebacteria bacterium]